MLIENKSIPERWTNKLNHLKIMKKILKNEDMKTIAVTNMQNNIIKEKYNKDLKENLPKIMDKYKPNSAFEFDNDLMTLMVSKRSNIKKIKRFKNISEEYNDIIKKQNIKIEPPRPDSIKENLKNILDYRRKMALRFKYTNYCDEKSCKMNSALQKSRSQILNSISSSKYNTISTNNDIKSLNKINNVQNYNFISYKKNQKILKNNLNKDNTIKEYEEKFMITGMNNKKYKDNNNIIEEENIKYDESNEIERTNKIKKSQSVVF